jgi:hypothetical protein
VGVRFVSSVLLAGVLLFGCAAGESSSAGGGGDDGAGGDGTGGNTSASGSTSGGGGSGSMSASSTGGGPTGLECGICNDNNDIFDNGTPCGNALADCKADGPCGGWLMCIDQCTKTAFTKACIDNCDQTHAPAASLVDPIYACICESPCASECEPYCQT